VGRAEEIAAERGGVLARQFANEANPEIHRKTTAEEIWKDTDGAVDIVVAGIGTGGTITGIGQVFKQEAPNVITVAVEPVESQVLKGGTHNPHKLQGIGAGMIPAIYDAKVVDRITDVQWDDAVNVARRLSKEEGIFVGISSGAVAWAALEIAKELGAGKRVVAVLPDTGERYLSTALFEFTDLVNQPATTPAMLAAQAAAAPAPPAP
jgi:cysteine synthase A